MFGLSHSFSVFVFLKSLGIGYLLGLVYTFFKLLRMIGLRHSILVFFQDVLYFVISAFVVFLFVLEINAGIFRFYIFIGILIGFILFYLMSFSIFHYCFRRIKNRCANHKKRAGRK